MNYLRTDEQDDVLVSLLEVRRQLELVEANQAQWKFAVIATTLAVNGALVCFLTGTMGTGALKEEDAEEMVQALQSGSDIPIPEPFLAVPKELLNRAAGGKRFDTVSRQLQITAQQRRSFELLVDFRNYFIHFRPTSWSIEISGLPNRCADVMQIVEDIRDNGWAFRHLSCEKKERLKATLLAIRQKLTELDLLYKS